MSVVAVCAAPGTPSATTTALVLAASMPAGQPVLLAECDPSGGDVAAWAELRETPGWATAVAAGDRSWSGLQTHFQATPSGLHLLTAPTQAGVARMVVGEAAARFAGLLVAMSDVITVADCGRLIEPSPWVSAATLTLVVVRQAPTSTGATVARIDRTRELFDHHLGDRRDRAAVVVVGVRPYDPAEVAGVVDGELFGVLPEDPIGAGLAAGAWTIGRGASRSALARAAGPLSARLVERVSWPATVEPAATPAVVEASPKVAR